MAKLYIRKSGLLTTIQDKGREGYLKYGITKAGAMDEYSMQLANLLVNNDRYEAVIEITLIGPEIMIDFNGAIAITGANMSPKLNNMKVNMYQTLYVTKGDILSFGQLICGARTYVAISGGLNIKSVMGSKSTHLRSKIGGYEGRQLKNGDEIYVNTENLMLSYTKRKIPVDMIKEYKKTYTARVILGPEEYRFTEEGIDTFLNNNYTLTNKWDRMGCRLEGKRIEHSNGADILSGGLTLGAIQVAGDGQPIIMMADRQTTGGYTKIANVISVDVPFIAQLKPGDTVNFKKTTIEEAQKLICDVENEITKLNNIYKSDNCNIQVNGFRNFSVNINKNKYNIGLKEINNS